VPPDCKKNIKPMEELAEKIRLQRGVHDIYLDRLMLFVTIQKILNVIISCFVTLIVFADFGLIEKTFPQYSGIPVMISVGLLSFILLIINSLSEVFQFSTKQLSHQSTIYKYTLLLTKVKLCIQKNETDRHEDLSKEYLNISNDSINFGGKKFDRARKNYMYRKLKSSFIKKDVATLFLKKCPFGKDETKKIETILKDKGYL